MNHRLSPIIVHLLGFIAVSLMCLLLFAYNLFHTAANHRYALAQLVKPSVLKAMLTFRQTLDLPCTLPARSSLPTWLNPTAYQIIAPVAATDAQLVATKLPSGWTIALTDPDAQSLTVLVRDITFPKDTLVSSSAPIRDQFMYPDCHQAQCWIYQFDLSTRSLTRFPAFASADKLPLGEINQVIFDESRQIVSYTIGPAAAATRVVVTPQLDLLQTINETPSPQHRLQLKGYLAEAGALVYFDPANQLTYYFLADAIGFYRQACASPPSLSL